MMKPERAQEERLASDARYRHTLDAMLEGCQILDSDWRYLYINDAAEKHNRRPKVELLGKRYMDMWPGEERDLISSYQLGVNAYVVKPVDFKDFIEAVKQIGVFWAVINELPPAGV